MHGTLNVGLLYFTVDIGTNIQQCKYASQNNSCCVCVDNMSNIRKMSVVRVTLSLRSVTLALLAEKFRFTLFLNGFFFSLCVEKPVCVCVCVCACLHQEQSSGTFHLNCKASPWLYILQDSETVLRLEYLNQIPLQWNHLFANNIYG
jgi:hypothetical protein